MLPKQYNIQVLRIADTEEEFQETCRQFKESFVTAKIRYNKHIIWVDSLGTGWQGLVTVHTWHPQNYKKLGHDGKFIVGMHRHEKRWELHLASNTGITDQNISMFEDLDNLKSFIKRQWKNGWDITDLQTVDNKYYLVTSKGLNLKQGWSVREKFSWEDANKAYETGLILTEVTRVEDKYLWIFSGNTGFEYQALEYNPNKVKLKEIGNALITDNKFEGYSLASIREVSGRLLFIFVS